MTVRIELKRAEFRQKTLETFLLYLFTYEMPLERVRLLLDKVEGQALRGFPELKGSGLRWGFCRELTERLRFVEASVALGEPLDVGTCEDCSAEKAPRFEVPNGKSVCKKCRPKYVEDAVDDRKESGKPERTAERVLADVAQIVFTEAWDPAEALRRVQATIVPDPDAFLKIEVTP